MDFGSRPVPPKLRPSVVLLDRPDPLTPLSVCHRCLAGCPENHVALAVKIAPLSSPDATRPAQLLTLPGGRREVRKGKFPFFPMRRVILPGVRAINRKTGIRTRIDIEIELLLRYANSEFATEIFLLVRSENFNARTSNRSVHFKWPLRAADTEVYVSDFIIPNNEVHGNLGWSKCETGDIELCHFQELPRKPMFYI